MLTIEGLSAFMSCGHGDGEKLTASGRSPRPMNNSLIRNHEDALLAVRAYGIPRQRLVVPLDTDASHEEPRLRIGQ